MAAVLEVRDGAPYWWDSPDIWVVPGSDPGGPPGRPIAGAPSYLWARVHNKGDRTASGARVNFYWSNPATGVLRSNSTPVGAAFVDLGPGESKDVLCLAPWVPVVVNDGHECVVAEVIHPDDPLPTPLGDAFNPPEHHQIAQKNLSVIVASTMQVLPIQIAAPLRHQKQLRLTLEIGGAVGKEALARAGLGQYRPAKCAPPRAELSLRGGCADQPSSDCHDAQGAKELAVALQPGTARAVYLRLWPAALPERGYLPVRVIAHAGERIDGGLTYILIGKEG